MMVERCWLALAAVVLLGAPPGGQAATDSISFTEPARIEHESLDAHASWIGVVIPAHAAANGTLSLDGGGAGVVKRMALFHGEYGWLPHPTFFSPLPERQATPPRAQSATLSVGDGDGSLWFQAERLDFGADSGISMLSSSDVPCMTALAPADGGHGWSWKFAGTACIDEASAFLTSDGAGTWVRVRAQGITALGMHNVTVTCDRGDCIEGGGFYRIGTPQGAPGSTFVDEYQYSHYKGLNASIDMVVPATWLAVGGSSMDLQFAGSARLAKASPSSCQDHCWMDGDGTAAVEGKLLLSGLRPASNGRLEAQLSGDIMAARLDQVPVASFSATDAIAVTGSLALLLGALKLGAALLTRRSDPLKHPNRRRLYEAVKEHPGATFRELVRRTEIPTGTARHHLQVLAQANLISIRQHKETLRHFDNHGRFDDSWRAVTLLREPELRMLCAWLAEHPGVHQRGIMEASTQWGWSRSTTQHRLRRLEAEGLVTVVAQGRLKCYSVAAQVATLAQSMPARASADAPAVAG